MKLIPVLDLKNGVIVRGIAGNREAYQPIQSQLCSQADPLAVATSIQNHFGLSQFYLADLDAIAGNHLNRETYKLLASSGFTIDVDAGVTQLDTIFELFQAGVNRVIIALETLPSRDFLKIALGEFGTDRVLFSLDLRNGLPITGIPDWATESPLQIAREVVNLGISNLIVLDISAVGTGAGLTTSHLCHEIADQFPQLELISGGGIRTAEEIRELAEQKYLSGLLVASALHDGSIPADLIESLENS
ncbi:MAG: HisA/HisF-related TIM barrel protein [Planctomycetaceae bacterium]